MTVKLNFDTAALRVCVDRADAGHIAGRVVGRRLTRTMEFSDLGGLLLQVEGVLDAQNFPQAFQRARTFAPAQPQRVPAAGEGDGMEPQAVDTARGEAFTFLLHIVSRRNSTWQGLVEWTDSGEREEYGSVLELIKLIDRHIAGAPRG